ncbi:hypothetical protein [Flavobacterium lindanitolerans]|uniref:hypothetical protein n=1 Tax=Flavobacterium lindanitolerans TaxID=428988 RepID=UPI0027B90FA6|nr:hypothetical protein [Flavobacterium lindanitolerans]
MSKFKLLLLNAYDNAYDLATKKSYSEPNSLELQELIATQKDLIKMQKDKIEELERKLSEGKKGKDKVS